MEKKNHLCYSLQGPQDPCQRHDENENVDTRHGDGGKCEPTENEVHDGEESGTKGEAAQRRRPMLGLYGMYG